MPRRTRVILNLPTAVYRKLFQKKLDDGYGDKTLEDYIEWFAKDAYDTSITKETISELHAMWMFNFAENLPYIRYGDKLQMTANEYVQNNLVELAEPEFPDFEHPPKSSAVVVGGGPSVELNNHLDLLANAIHDGYNGIIVATDKMLVQCLEKGIIPDLTTTVDGHISVKKFYEHPLVHEHASQIKVATSVTMNNEVYLACRDAGVKVYWFYAMQDDWRKTYSFTKMEGLMVKSKHFTKQLQKVACGGNTGYVAWVMASTLYKRAPVALIGMDLGYPEGSRLEKSTYFSVIDHMPVSGSVKARSVQRLYQDVYHPVYKKHAKTDRVFINYKEAFLAAQDRMKPWYAHYGGTINCTEGGTLFGKGVTCTTFKEFLEKY